MANTLNLGNGNWGVKKDSLLAYNSENGNYKPLPFDFTRASSATVVNKAGLIETVGSGEPRIDFLGNTKGALKLEPQRSNLITYSEDFSNAYWSKLNTTINSNASTSPDGTTNASLIYPTTSGTDRLIEKVSSATTGQVWTSSFFVKASGFNWVLIYAPNLGVCWFNASTGIFGNVANGVIAKVLGQVNNFWRISLTGTLSSSNAYFYAGVADLNGTTFATASGTNGISIYGAQLEQGSYATSYIPTSGSAVTRVADACNNGANEQVINSTEGVFYAEISALADDGTFRILSLSSGSATNRILIYYSSDANAIVYEITYNSSQTAYFSHTLSDSTELNKLAIKWKVNDFAFWVNGTEVHTVSSGNPPSGLNLLNFSNSTGYNNFYGNIKDVRVYNTALTDSELATLTTI